MKTSNMQWAIDQARKHFGQYSDKAEYYGYYRGLVNGVFASDSKCEYYEFINALNIVKALGNGERA